MDIIYQNKPFYMYYFRCYSADVRKTKETGKDYNNDNSA
jgi:hypothetical protein